MSAWLRGRCGRRGERRLACACGAAWRARTVEPLPRAHAAAAREPGCPGAAAATRGDAQGGCWPRASSAATPPPPIPHLFISGIQQLPAPRARPPQTRGAVGGGGEEIRRNARDRGHAAPVLVQRLQQQRRLHGVAGLGVPQANRSVCAARREELHPSHPRRQRADRRHAARVRAHWPHGRGGREEGGAGALRAELPVEHVAQVHSHVHPAAGEVQGDRGDGIWAAGHRAQGGLGRRAREQRSRQRHAQLQRDLHRGLVFARVHRGAGCAAAPAGATASRVCAVEGERRTASVGQWRAQRAARRLPKATRGALAGRGGREGQRTGSSDAARLWGRAPLQA